MKRLILITLGVLLLITGILVSYFEFRPKTASRLEIPDIPAIIAQQIAIEEANQAKPDPDSVAGRAAKLECDLTPEAIFNPTRFEFERSSRTLPMLSLAYDEGGIAPAAPPLEQTHTIGWFNQGPALGADKGRAILTGHTYTYTQGIGNELLNGLLKPGDIVKVSNEQGQNACYRFKEYKDIVVANYNEDSTDVYDPEGDPQLGIIVCDHYEPGTDLWLSRGVFYADLLTESSLESLGD